MAIPDCMRAFWKVSNPPEIDAPAQEYRESGGGPGRITLVDNEWLDDDDADKVMASLGFEFDFATSTPSARLYLPQDTSVRSDRIMLIRYRKPQGMFLNVRQICQRLAQWTRDDLNGR